VVVKLSAAFQELPQSSLLKHKKANVSGLMLPIVITLQLISTHLQLPLLLYNLFLEDQKQKSESHS
jgi:hypothetical protein